MGRDRKFVMSQQDFMGLCRDREIQCRDIVGQDGTIFYRDRGFLGRDRIVSCRDRVG